MVVLPLIIALWLPATTPASAQRLETKPSSSKPQTQTGDIAAPILKTRIEPTFPAALIDTETKTGEVTALITVSKTGKVTAADLELTDHPAFLRRSKRCFSIGGSSPLAAMDKRSKSECVLPGDFRRHNPKLPRRWLTQKLNCRRCRDGSLVEAFGVHWWVWRLAFPRRP